MLHFPYANPFNPPSSRVRWCQLFFFTTVIQVKRLKPSAVGKIIHLLSQKDKVADSAAAMRC